jgi:glycosyltransferase involved in cell wall biosynthesis
MHKLTAARDTVVLAPAGYLLDPEIGSDYERPWRLADGLAQRGMRVVIVAREVRNADRLSSNVDIRRPPGNSPTTPVAKLIDRMNLYMHARRVAYAEAASGRALVVHHVGPCGDWSPSVIGKLPVPFVYGPLPGERPRKLTYDEWLLWLRTPGATAFQQRASRLAAGAARPVAHSLWRRTIRRATMITVEARANAPKDRSNIVVIPPGVDVVRFTPLPTSEHVPGRVVAVGSLVPRKGFDTLIRAVGLVIRYCPQAHLVVVGAGPQETFLRSLASQLGIGASISFTGNIRRDELPALLRSAEVFCHPARWDPFPLAVLEAMACGLPTVVSSVGALPEIVGGAGVVHRTSDENDLARKLLELLAQPALRGALGTAARNRVVAHFTWSVMVDSYLQLYRTLAEAGLNSGLRE